MFFISLFPLPLLGSSLEYLTSSSPTSAKNDYSGFLSNFSFLSGSASGVGDWIFGLLACPVYGEPVLGTIVAYPAQQKGASRELRPLEFLVAATFASYRSIDKRVMLLNPKEFASDSLPSIFARSRVHRGLVSKRRCRPLRRSVLHAARVGGFKEPPES